MPTLLAQLIPQRGSQYAELVAALAPHELALSPLGPLLCDLTPITLAGQAFLRCTLTALPDDATWVALGAPALIAAFYEEAHSLDDRPGPWLRPLEPPFTPAFPPDLAIARRYRGKTNELLTHLLCNLARGASHFAQAPWSELRVFDPLAGGGTVLFTALILGAEVAGVEQDVQDVQSTATYLRQFMAEARLACRLKEERLRGLGKRWSFGLGNPPRRCILAQGDTTQSAALVAGFKPHLLVTDLPYGIQHQGPLRDLLNRSLPVWAGVLPPGGALAFAWDATRFPREEMTVLLETAAPFAVLNAPPYDRLAHRVDRVIKRRDILVAVRL
jgi:hypothetical protein